MKAAHSLGLTCREYLEMLDASGEDDSVLDFWDMCEPEARSLEAQVLYGFEDDIADVQAHYARLLYPEENVIVLQKGDRRLPVMPNMCLIFDFSRYYLSMYCCGNMPEKSSDYRADKVLLEFGDCACVDKVSAPFAQTSNSESHF